jgi:D-alanyl-D-alanine carboxypeptidase
MTFRRKAIPVVVGTAALLPLAAIPAGADQPSQLQRDLDAIVAAGATSATAEIDTGQSRTLASAGVTAVGSNRPAPSNGRFRMGSVTKTFVATVILQLVAEHRLGLDDKVSAVLPGVLKYGDDITVRELLNHTSGVPEVLKTLPSPRSAEFLKIRWKTWTDAELVARVADQQLDFTPGKAAGYSNTNYLLLGMIIERVTGKSYATEIRDRIIRPLRLTKTSVPGTNPFIVGPHAHGYLDIDDKLVDITAVNPSIMGAAGEMISTTADLNRFFEALFAGRLLPPALLKEMRTTALDSKYGLGVITYSPGCNITAYGKDGDAPGYSAWSFNTGGKQITVSVRWGAGDSDDAVDTLLDHAMC